MAGVVNLRLARKRKQRTDAEARAAENRSRHGRTKAEKQRDRAEEKRASTALDGHRRYPEPDA
jgi:hypothetical protein